MTPEEYAALQRVYEEKVVPKIETRRYDSLLLWLTERVKPFLSDCVKVARADLHILLRDED